MTQEKKLILVYSLYVLNNMGLLWLASRYTIATYVIYSQIGVYLALVVIHRKIRVGPTGAGVWPGNKPPVDAVVSLLVRLPQATSSASRAVTFLDTVPLGVTK